MIKLKDVIHYYIGCDVIVDRKEHGRLMGANPIPNSVGQVYWDIITDDMKAEDEDFCMPYNDDPDIGDLRIKPILRRIEDSTVDEQIEFGKLMGTTETAYTVVKYHTPASFNWLIKNKFDLFGLIETEQAIDAKIFALG